MSVSIEASSPKGVLEGERLRRPPRSERSDMRGALRWETVGEADTYWTRSKPVSIDVHS